MKVILSARALGLAVPQPIFQVAQAPCKSRLTRKLVRQPIPSTASFPVDSATSPQSSWDMTSSQVYQWPQRSSTRSGELGERTFSFPFQNHCFSFSFRSLGKRVQYNQPTKWRMLTKVSIREIRNNFQTLTRGPNKRAGGCDWSDSKCSFIFL